jgi:hypothetical protein
VAADLAEELLVVSRLPVAPRRPVGEAARWGSRRARPGTGALPAERAAGQDSPRWPRRTRNRRTSAGPCQGTSRREDS